MKKENKFDLANTIYDVWKYRKNFVIDTQLDKPFYDWGQNRLIKLLCKGFKLFKKPR